MNASGPINEASAFSECPHGVAWAKRCNDCDEAAEIDAAEIDALEAELDALILEIHGDPGLTRWPAGLEEELDLLHERRAARRSHRTGRHV